jgi:PAS domain S-box-containing protein
MVKERLDSPPALRSATDGLWDWDLSTDQVYWSPGWKAMLGYAESDIGVSSNEWFDRVHPEDLVPVSQALAIHLDDQSTHLEIEHRVLDGRGIYRWMRCRAAIIRDSLGVATRLAGSFSAVREA